MAVPANGGFEGMRSVVPVGAAAGAASGGRGGVAVGVVGGRVMLMELEDGCRSYVKQGMGVGAAA